MHKVFLARTLVLFSLLSAPLLAQSQAFQQTILKPGEGTPAAKGDIITVHYTGWLSDSTRFDSSRDREEPLEFSLGAGMVIAGWEKGLLGMKPGEVRRLVIPPELGYGERAVGPIPENSVLVFEVEMLSVQKGMGPDEFPKDLAQWKWTTLSTGVDVRTEKSGAGAKAQMGNRILVHHTGWLLGGTRFASSRTLSKPMDVVLGAGQVIRGWEVGLQGMQVGEVRWLKVQSSQGYGSAALAKIPPNSELLFRVECVELDADHVEEGLDVFPDTTQITWQEGREGLRYSVLRKGEGEAAVANQKVDVHYTGWLLDGTRFDSSRERGAFSFAIAGGQVIRGWDLGVEGMLPGEVRLLSVPSGLAYGSRGTGPIPPNSPLLFQVEYIGPTAQ